MESLDSDSFSVFLDLICAHPEQVRSLSFAGPNFGYNGVRAWAFHRVLETEAVFTNLLKFSVQLHEVGHHNLVCFGDPRGGSLAIRARLQLCLGGCRVCR